MSNRDKAAAKAGPDDPLDLEGEPSPVDLLASLMRNDAGAPAASREPAAVSAPRAELRREDSVSAAARALAAQPGNTDAQDPTAMQRTLVAIRNALPLLQKLLPLLDGNILGAVVGMLSHQPQQHQPQQPPPKPVDLSPVENSLAEMKRQSQEMRSQIAAQDEALKKLAEHLDHVRETTERNTREQEELVEELKVSSKRMNIVAFLAFALLAASIAMNVVLYLQIHRLVP